MRNLSRKEIRNLCWDFQLLLIQKGVDMEEAEKICRVIEKDLIRKLIN